MQGVWFRAWTAEQARLRGLKGWIRNRRDGSVEAHVAGAPEAIAELERWLGVGPPGSHVRSVERSPSLLPIPADGFTIEG